MTVRRVEEADVAAIAAIRAAEWETEAFWRERISAYLTGAYSPQHALPDRTGLVAVDESEVVGFVAGHRTRRFHCDGELQWVNVVAHRRGEGIAATLVKAMAAWFAELGAVRVCVNVEPENERARTLYARAGAQPLNRYWMVWADCRVMLR